MANFQLGIVDYIIFIVTIPEVLYLVLLFKNADYFFDGLSRAQSIDSNIQHLLVDPETQQRYEEQLFEAKEKHRKVKKAYNKKYHRDWILAITLFCIVGFYTFIFM